MRELSRVHEIYGNFKENKLVVEFWYHIYFPLQVIGGLRLRQSLSICLFEHPARILLHDTIVHSIKVLLLIAHQLHWPIVDVGHDLLSISCIDFQTYFRMEWTRFLLYGILVHHIHTFFGITHQLLWPIFDLGHDLVSQILTYIWPMSWPSFTNFDLYLTYTMT